MAVDFERVQELTRELLIAIGEDPDREGLIDTPKRYAKWWKEFMDHDAGKVETAFEIENSDEMVAVTGMKVWSLCEHHLLPFSATVSIGYIPKDKVLGLSKFARIAHEQAHKLQLQERLVNDIADRLSSIMGTEDIAVVADGSHSCMTMRGVRTEGSMRTSVMRGVFRQEHETRNEFLTLVSNQRN
jgi:GTP cyclohydrolase IA